MAQCPQCGEYEYGHGTCSKCGTRRVKVERRYKPLNDERIRYQALADRRAELATQRRMGVDA